MYLHILSDKSKRKIHVKADGTCNGTILQNFSGTRFEQALPCWPTAPSFLLQVSGHDSLTVQSLLTQTGELPNTRWLDRCANPLARPLLQAWAWSPRWSKGGEWGALIPLLFLSHLTTTETWYLCFQPKNGIVLLSACPPARPAS